MISQIYCKTYLLKTLTQNSPIMCFLLFFTKVYWKSKNLGPSKYAHEKILDPRNTTKKIETCQIPKNLGLRKYPREKMWGSRNTHNKIFWTNKIPTRKIFGLTKTRWQDGTRPTIAGDPRNLAHSFLSYCLNEDNAAFFVFVFTKSTSSPLKIPKLRISPKKKKKIKIGKKFVIPKLLRWEKKSSNLLQWASFKYGKVDTSKT